ncbi:MAG: glycoside hydrolase family 2 protein [Spirochaetes bacterium]|nr:glycoside hydrolase family 2 protein [Spirochaetota bacterium]
MKIIELANNWKMKRCDETDYQPAKVPGSVLADLLRNGKISDPFYGKNEKEITGIFNHSFEYVTEFAVDQNFFNCTKKTIRFEGLDTLTTIFLNSKEIAKTNNMHRIYEFDVNELLKPNNNQLHIIFHSPLKWITEQQRRMPLWGVDDAVPGYPHIRKAHYMFGWDWGPQLVDAGIWRKISLIGYETASINDVYICQKHNEQIVELTVEISVKRVGEESQIFAELQIFNPENISIFHETKQIEKKKKFTFKIENPDLWWPNGYGDQPLYKIELKLLHNKSIVDQILKWLGLRTLTVNREVDQFGKNFALEVNGKTIFAMGANYIPEDPILSHTSLEKTEKLIKDCVKANFNCLRIWGGGIYPDDYFFDLCDRYGLIVWHDFMFACAQYNMTEEFTQNIVKEVEDNVQRIRHHACLGLWCGNNEMEWGWMEWAFPKSEKLRQDYLYQFEKVIPDVLSRVDPHTFYWPASPSSGGGFLEPNAEHSGDVHWWEVFHGLKPYTDYTQYYFRFASEFGMQSFPAQTTINSYVPKEQQNVFSQIMEYHNKCKQGNQIIMNYIFFDFLMPKNLEMTVYASQIMQAEAIACGVEHWRRNRGRCMGATYWQLNDSYPGPSWSSIDYYGRWKALHYFTKRVYSRKQITAQFENDLVSFYFLNETLSEQSVTLAYQLVHQEKGTLVQGPCTAEAGPLSSVCIKKMRIKDYLVTDEQKQNTWLEYSFTDEQGKKQQRTMIFVKPKYFQFKKPEFSLNITKNNITILSNVYSKYVELYLKKQEIQFADNFFDLVPGQPVTIPNPLRSKKELESKILYRSVYDIAK